MGAFKERLQPHTLEDIFADPEAPLLLDRPVAEEKRGRGPRQDPAVTNFLPVLEFARANRREPSPDGEGNERLLARRLAKYREDATLAAKARPFDDLGLLGRGRTPDEKEGELHAARRLPKHEADSLPAEQRLHQGSHLPDRQPASLDDVLADPESDLLLGPGSDIFRLVHVKPKASITAPAEVATRKPCPDFAPYKEIFDGVVQKIRGHDPCLLLEKPQEKHVRPGAIFILRGQICLVVSADEKRSGYLRGQTIRNPRLRIVFDNGMQADLLYQSLLKDLYTDRTARHVGVNRLAGYGDAQAGADGQTAGTTTGYIYVLESLTKEPALQRYRKAHCLTKVGFTRHSVEERLEGAELSQTYLCAPVVVCNTIACKDFPPGGVEKFEALIHDFLAPRRLNVTLRDKATGQVWRPCEWFTVSPQTATEVARRIVDGSIKDVRLDKVKGVLVPMKGPRK